MSENSCVETPAAPEWLSKLEDRRERLKRGILGHEAGAGAPCNECGDKCPGLDLHFWRKVCRNCKCRKDQHLCVTNDTLSGWAQFEILGQIRSKPAFIKIKALASQMVLVEWIPPNIGADLARDYMEKMGANNVPVTGSRAATKRKQQLEFQVPPHDVDANLCDNLSESESQQMQQYVEKIREHCVGQGCVVRVGTYGQGVLSTLPEEKSNQISSKLSKSIEVLKCLQTDLPDSVSIEHDPILSEILGNSKIAKAVLEPVPYNYPKIFMAFMEPFADFNNENNKVSPTTGNCFEPQIRKLIRPQMVQNLHGLNEAAIRSAVLHGAIYDRVFEILKDSNLDVTRDPRLGPLADLRSEYKQNPQFRLAIEANYSVQKNDDNRNPISGTSLQTPTKSFSEMSLSFNSPLAPLQCSNRFTSPAVAQLIAQETPIRKMQSKFMQSLSNGNLDEDQQPLEKLNTFNREQIRALGLPSNVDYTRDHIFSAILNSLSRPNNDEVTTPLNSHQINHGKPLQDDYKLSEVTQRKLQQLNVHGTKLLQSVILNAPFYERLFETIKHQKGPISQNSKISGIQCIGKLLETLRNDREMYEELRELVNAIPSSLEIAYAPVSLSEKNLYSDLIDDDCKISNQVIKDIDPSFILMKAEIGKYPVIPGIEEMNMYPTVQPSNVVQMIENDHKLDSKTDQKSSNQSKCSPISQVTVACKDCEKLIYPGEVVVKAARAGKEVSWHPDCFKCAECHELLADLVYFFHGGQVYCGRDLAVKLNIPRCKACDELIFTKEYTAAEGCNFHIKHFCCFQCDHPLAGQQYVPDEKTNMPLCLPCYDQFYAASCQYCNHPIGPTDQGVSWSDLHWHSKCFICGNDSCQVSLIGKRFCIKQNKPFCSAECIRKYPQ